MYYWINLRLWRTRESTNSGRIKFIPDYAQYLREETDKMPDRWIEEKNWFPPKNRRKLSARRSKTPREILRVPEKQDDFRTNADIPYDRSA